MEKDLNNKNLISKLIKENDELVMIMHKDLWKELGLQEHDILLWEKSGIQELNIKIIRG